MHRMATQMDRTVVPMDRMQELRKTRPRRSVDFGERAVEAYFAVLTIVILGMIVGIACYAVFRVIPDWERSHSSQDGMYHNRFEVESHSSELK